MSDNYFDLQLELQQIFLLADDANEKNYHAICDKICQKVLKLLGQNNQYKK